MGYTGCFGLLDVGHVVGGRIGRRIIVAFNRLQSAFGRQKRVLHLLFAVALMLAVVGAPDLPFVFLSFCHGVYG
jgi:hypothetical protein